MPITLNNFKNEVYTKFNNILNYWINYSVDSANGGFYVAVDGKNQPKLNEDKGIVLKIQEFF